MVAVSSLSELQAQVHAEVGAAGRPVKRLFPWVLDRRNLLAAWHKVRAADGANTPGPDGQTAADVDDQNVWLARIADELCHGRYRPRPPRWVEVPKSPGSAATRRLGVLNLRDRVVHGAVKQVLEPVLEGTFHPRSFGYRPGRSVPGAAEGGIRLRQEVFGPIIQSWERHWSAGGWPDQLDSWVERFARAVRRSAPELPGGPEPAPEGGGSGNDPT